MSHFGRQGPPDIADTYSLLVLNITFRNLSLSLSIQLFLSTSIQHHTLLFPSGTTADDLFPLFDKYGKVVDIFIPRDRRYFSICLLIRQLIYFFHLLNFSIVFKDR